MGIVSFKLIGDKCFSEVHPNFIYEEKIDSQGQNWSRDEHDTSP